MSSDNGTGAETDGQIDAQLQTAYKLAEGRIGKLEECLRSLIDYMAAFTNLRHSHHGSKLIDRARKLLSDE